MRQIVLDTETTGLKPTAGHRIIEIGCIELVHRRFTGNTFHVYINPERMVDKGAYEVHGISDEFLQDKPLFNEIVKDFLNFVDGTEVIIHNAPFDVGFINHELKLHYQKKARKFTEYCQIFDTLPYARQRHPGQRNNLDALCKRYQIDNSNRDLHGALLDAQLLGRVYLAMTSGQNNLFVEEGGDKTSEMSIVTNQTGSQQQRAALRVIKASEEELKAHEAIMATIAKV